MTHLRRSHQEEDDSQTTSQSCCYKYSYCCYCREQSYDEEKF
eukprot:CAMPEP_0114668534 /NCGR_PEP_ID=MMETSP0191-20121206/36438_1 /TAXON_ID=126664 /ORGANISM="Sorites sp." /LENGTH=41 /DNA_ID= /DNA_START= /DNA_END= /DNA_ORIENTATION=